ncbi:hypothetical protein CAI21_08695 [Alkalilimnicola ehrlichii]|uniref:Response regulatory domain-containing protein n=1 Tax=Alkalilimnicola ehrlichii TaxID=351052 RepID=A0A3E0WUI0_9GAMM|nr:response regulator [Alkalilimnicola ehrlichii]RFA29899.1 hypothetical protein CAI21_08695 [Alkalilimnicola ehrlichii]RFA36488.1 hypothetical protein CAL65_10965 [Alkalilimnicola ehrlichii]
MPKASILIVDDARLVRGFIKKAFSRTRDYELQEAEDGTQAQAALLAARYDLVLCDWDMPNMDGHALLQWMRAQADERLGRTPFIMVTSSGEKEKVLQAVKAGVNGYLVKPFTAAQLTDKVHEVLARQQQQNVDEDIPDEEAGAYVANLRYREETLRVQVANITTKGLLGKYKASLAGPSLLSSVVAELPRRGSDSPVSIKGYIYRIEAGEDSCTPKYLQVGVRFQELDADKREFLIDCIAALRF